MVPEHSRLSVGASTWQSSSRIRHGPLVLSWIRQRNYICHYLCRIQGLIFYPFPYSPTSPIRRVSHPPVRQVSVDFCSIAPDLRSWSRWIISSFTLAQLALSKYYSLNSLSCFNSHFKPIIYF